MQLNLPWLTAAPARKVFAAIVAAGGEVRFVGGCVRDAVIGRIPLDFDLATNLLPEQVMVACQAAGCKVIPTGLKHGTLTIVSQDQVFEITTLRRDVTTDGRHAKVAFSDDWREDAARRDFTMNALFCDASGVVTDYFGGVEDARAGRVRFVGDAETRLREDVLRILRFFRFHAHFGKGQPDEDGINACRRLVDLLPKLSAERVRTELLKLLSAPNPVPVLRVMEEIGVFRVLNLPMSVTTRLDTVVRHIKSDALLRLWAMVEEGTDVISRLRLSNAEAKRLRALNPVPVIDDVYRAAYRIGLRAVMDILIVNGKDVPPALETWSRPNFPLHGNDIPAQGAQLGEALRRVERWWVDHDFVPDRGACLVEAKRILQLL